MKTTRLSDDGFRALQNTLMKNPGAGGIIEGSGGLRKLRYADVKRGKGKRGGLRVTYFWWNAGQQLWLFTLYDRNDVLEDLRLLTNYAMDSERPGQNPPGQRRTCGKCS
nr:hypothetical protein [Ferrovum sp.]